MPKWDTEAMRDTADKIGGLAQPFTDVGNTVNGPRASPFGALANSAGIASALGTFTDGIRAEFAAASGLMHDTQTSLRQAADKIDGTDGDNRIVVDRPRDV